MPAFAWNIGIRYQAVKNLDRKRQQLGRAGMGGDARLVFTAA
jgi:hypothetical protein